MSTVVELTEQELADLKTLTQQADVSAPDRCAMTEYLRFARRQRLKALSGQVEMDDNWQNSEASELGKLHGNR